MDEQNLSNDSEIKYKKESKIRSMNKFFMRQAMKEK